MEATEKMPDSEKSLPASFYSRDPAAVAWELLGKRLVRVMNGEVLEGTIVETEAYFGAGDPASRAFHGRKNYNRLMWGEPGRVFIYNVHRYWMLNIVAHEPNKIGAVLIRAIEPTRGVGSMLGNRPVKEPRALTSGPGKLTLALGIDKGSHGVSVLSPGSEIRILDASSHLEIVTSRRIGVTRDLDRDLRFYVEGNPYVSR
jgi:DNA-3-methyladenine glycosylase